MMSEDKYHLKAKSTPELMDWIAGYKTSTPMYIAGMEELRRRGEKPIRDLAWWALIVSVLSVLVAVFALFK